MNYDHTKVKGQVFTLPSCAVPNESYTARQLYEKHLKKQSLPPIARPVSYSETDSHNSFDYEELKRMDLVDQEAASEFIIGAVTRGRNAQAKIKAAADKKAAEEKAEEEAMKAEFKKRVTTKKKIEGSGQKGANDDN